MDRLDHVISWTRRSPSTDRDQLDFERNAELDAVLATDCVSFQHLVAHRCQSAQQTSDPGTRTANSYYARELRAAFTRRHGVIIDEFYCHKTTGAAALTENCLVMVYGHDDAAIAKLLFECEMLSSEMRQTLSGPSRMICMERVFTVVRTLLHLLDEEEQPSEPPDHQSAEQPIEDLTRRRAIEYQRQAIRSVESYYTRTAERVSIRSYIFGMCAAIVAGLYVATMLSYLLIDVSDTTTRIRNVVGTPPDSMVVCLLAGGAGAVFSVMQRVTMRKLTVDHTAGRFMVLALGAIRPIVGAASAFIIYSLVRSGILPLEVPQSDEETYFWVVLGFLAGFSERFAQDTIAMTEGRLSGGGSLMNQGGEPATDRSTRSVREDERHVIHIFPDSATRATIRRNGRGKRRPSRRIGAP
jgi:hypothetical protein